MDPKASVLPTTPQIPTTATFINMHREETIDTTVTSNNESGSLQPCYDYNQVITSGGKLYASTNNTFEISLFRILYQYKIVSYILIGLIYLNLAITIEI